MIPAVLVITFRQLIVRENDSFEKVVFLLGVDILVLRQPTGRSRCPLPNKGSLTKSLNTSRLPEPNRDGTFAPCCGNSILCPSNMTCSISSLLIWVVNGASIYTKWSCKLSSERGTNAGNETGSSCNLLRTSSLVICEKLTHQILRPNL